MSSNFHFLSHEYPELARLTELAENILYLDPSTILTKLRIVTEKVTLIIGKHERFNDLQSSDK